MDYIIYNTFVSSFNKEYDKVLSENQKTLLNKYISSFSDNNLDLKIYLNEEIGRIKEEILKVRNSEENQTTKENLGEVYKILEKTKEKEIDTQALEIILNAQQILEEIEKDEN
jgi:hypothetical protein